jgi:hypothetical protein
MAVAFHFLLLAIGKVLMIDDIVTSQKVQDYIQNDDAFGVRLPLADCRLALMLMEQCGFIVKIADDKYVRCTGQGVID